MSTVPFTVRYCLHTPTRSGHAQSSKPAAWQLVPRIIHVSTDEVYGEVLDGACDESGLSPTNPYSASKAAAEMIVNGYRHSFKMPIIVIRANNVCGIQRISEKLIPRSIMSLIVGSKFTLHGDGNQRPALSLRARFCISTDNFWQKRASSTRRITSARPTSSPTGRWRPWCAKNSSSGLKTACSSRPTARSTIAATRSLGIKYLSLVGSRN